MQYYELIGVVNTLDRFNYISKNIINAYAKNSRMASHYAIYQKGSRFKEGEKVLLNDFKYVGDLLDYLRKFSEELKKDQNFMRDLKNIKTNNIYAVYTICEILEEPIKQFEPIIARDSAYSCKYAVYILNSRFKLGEHAILKDLVNRQRQIEMYYEYMGEDVTSTPYYLGDYLDLLYKSGYMIKFNKYDYPEIVKIGK